VLTRLRRESRVARKNRYSARHRALSTKSVVKFVISFIFFRAYVKKSLRNESIVSFAPFAMKNALFIRNEIRCARLEKIDPRGPAAMQRCARNARRILFEHGFGAPLVLPENAAANAAHGQ
jgi:hypothetical protein